MVAVSQQNSLSVCRSLSLALFLIGSQIWRPENYCSNSPAGISGSDNKQLHVIYSVVCIGHLLDFMVMVMKIFILLSPVQSMVFITLLLFTVTYIFAIAGVIFFESYTRSNRQDLDFHQSFRYYKINITYSAVVSTLVMALCS